jgi:ribosomal protein L16 Arg81 hydroxylase
MLDFGISPLQFESRYFEKNVYLRRGALDSSRDWSAIDLLLYQIEPRERLVNVFRHGPVSPQTYIESAIEFGTPRLRFNKSKLYNLLSEGATLVINRVENQLAAARRLCSDVCRFSGQQTISNGYLSFRGDGSFGRHWDTHDVFAIQLLGRKRWQIFGATMPLPLSHQKSDGREDECPAEPVLDCILESGDMLYVPRGWWHRAIPLESASFHVSVGAYAPTLYDYLMWACTRHLPQQVTARQALSRMTDPRELAAVLNELSRTAMDPQTIAEFARDIQARERTQTEFNLDLIFNRSDADLPDDALLTVNGNCYQIASNEILVNGNRWVTSATEDAVLSVLNQHAQMTFRMLRSQLSELSATSLAAEIKALARREVLTVRLPVLA